MIAKQKNKKSKEKGSKDLSSFSRHWSKWKRRKDATSFHASASVMSLLSTLRHKNNYIVNLNLLFIYKRYHVRLVTNKCEIYKWRTDTAELRGFMVKATYPGLWDYRTQSVKMVIFNNFLAVANPIKGVHELLLFITNKYFRFDQIRERLQNRSK